MLVEPDKTERPGQLRMALLQVVEDAKRLRRIVDLRQDAPLSVIYE
jgi:hypothetical protein